MWKSCILSVRWCFVCFSVPLLMPCLPVCHSDEDQVGHKSYDSGCSYPPLCLSWQIFSLLHCCSVFLRPRSVGCLLQGVELLHVHYCSSVHSHKVSFFSLNRPVTLVCIESHPRSHLVSSMKWTLKRTAWHVKFHCKFWTLQIWNYNCMQAICAIFSHLVQLSKI